MVEDWRAKEDPEKGIFTSVAEILTREKKIMALGWGKGEYGALWIENMPQMTEMWSSVALGENCSLNLFPPTNVF